jgi:hypothetical protein
MKEIDAFWDCLERLRYSEGRILSDEFAISNNFELEHHRGWRGEVLEDQDSIVQSL